jgi:hypothetical protein
MNGNRDESSGTDEGLAQDGQHTVEHTGQHTVEHTVGNTFPGLISIDTLAPGVPRVGPVGAPEPWDRASTSAGARRGTRSGTGEAAVRC